MKRVLAVFLLFIFFPLLVGAIPLQAETYRSHQYGFSIDIPNDWNRTQPKSAKTLFSYAKMGSGENLNFNVFDAEGLTSIKQVSPQQMFHPIYDSIRISRKNYEMQNGSEIFKCIYTIKDRKLKRRLEGKYDLKYFTVSWIKNGKQFTATFTDSKAAFDDNLASFESIIESIEFLK